MIFFSFYWFLLIFGGRVKEKRDNISIKGKLLYVKTKRIVLASLRESEKIILDLVQYQWPMAMMPDSHSGALLLGD